jgi:hypothetical protein
MEVGGYNKQVDFAKLGPTLVIASSLVLAIPHSEMELVR